MTNIKIRVFNIEWDRNDDDLPVGVGLYIEDEEHVSHEIRETLKDEFGATAKHFKWARVSIN